MKKLIFLLLLLPVLLSANNNQVASKIKEVTVYLNGAQIKRNAVFNLKQGTSEITFTGLSTKVNESSIQIGGLQAASILSMSYNINYLSSSDSNGRTQLLYNQIDDLDFKITTLNNIILGLEEEEKVISVNRSLNSNVKDLDLNKIKEISTYYRARITAIKNEIYTTSLQIKKLEINKRAMKNQIQEINQTPQKEHGEIKIVFDSAIETNLDLSITYIVSDAGWIPNYDLKSNTINTPLNLTYKAHVYQNTGNDWNNVKISLATNNPNINISKPDLNVKYLNFTGGYKSKYTSGFVKKNKYVYNPMVKQVTGIVTDESGAPVPGVNIVIKGSSKGTQTDFDGNYNLTIENGEQLVFSYLGFETQELPIFSSLMNVKMIENIEALDEVVVVGYGTSSGLNGRVSGVNIRGVTSKNEPKLPLYVVDGIVAKNFAEGDLDSNEIQSVEVLKGNNATSIYGNNGTHGVIVITTKKSHSSEELTNVKFNIKKSYTIKSNSDITAIEINTYKLNADYEYLAVPIINENVFLTAKFKDWEKYNLLPGEASIYFNGNYSGKTTIDPYSLKKEMTISLGVDSNISVNRRKVQNFKSKSFSGNNRILTKTYELVVKNNKTTSVKIKLLDRIPLSQNKEIKVDNIEFGDSSYNKKNGILSWDISLEKQQNQTKLFSYQIKHPKYKHISL